MRINTVEVNGWPIEYVVSGPEGAPPLVALSGWAQDHRLFRNIEPSLAQHFRVHRVNYRGHDQSLTQGDFTSEDLVDDTLALIDQLQLADVRLVSTSHGCWVNIGVHERLGAERSIGKTVVIDWLMRPFEGFYTQIREGHEPEIYLAARRSMFDEWTVGEECLDVVDHVNREMTWFGGDMWMRACREIEKNYRTWGDPLAYMSTLSSYLTVAHVYSQPLDPAYREYQEEYSAAHSWFLPKHIPGKTHFPTLESPVEVAAAITEFYGVG